MVAHVTLRSESQAPLVQAVIDATADVSPKELARFGVAALHTLLEGLLERMPRSSDALAKARLRGVLAQRELLDAEGGVLTGAELAKVLRVSRQAVDKRRKAGQLLALDVAKRGFLYPAWQVVGPSTLPGLAAVLAALPHDSPWADARFFLSGNHRLHDRRPLDLLRKGNIEPVVRAAKSFGEHGAA